MNIKLLALYILPIVTYETWWHLPKPAMITITYRSFERMFKKSCRAHTKIDYIHQPNKYWNGYCNSTLEFLNYVLKWRGNQTYNFCVSVVNVDAYNCVTWQCPTSSAWSIQREILSFLQCLYEKVTPCHEYSLMSRFPSDTGNISSWISI